MDKCVDLQSLWDGLLSRREARVRAVFAALSTKEQAAVITHLERMVKEPDWHIEQRKSAEAALEILRNEIE